MLILRRNPCLFTGYTGKDTQKKGVNTSLDKNNKCDKKKKQKKQKGDSSEKEHLNKSGRLI